MHERTRFARITVGTAELGRVRGLTKLCVISVLSVLSFPISLSFLASNHAAMANLIPAIANDNKGMIQ